MQDLLSQDEINALLHGVDEGEVDTSAEGGALNVRPYDLTSQEHVVRQRMPTLDMINESFARSVHNNLFNLLRRNAEVSVTGTKIGKFSEYKNSLYLPTSLNLFKLRPLRGTAVMALDAGLVFRMVDNFFGGSGRQVKIESRDFTPTEQRVVQMVLNQAYKDLVSAWQSVYKVELEPQRSVSNPELVNILSPGELIMITTFSVSFDGGGGGEIQLALPYKMIEPIRELLEVGLRVDPDDVDESWGKAIREDIMDASVEFSCQMFEQGITLRDVVDLEAGDVIPVDMPETVVLKANGVPMFNTRIGVSNGNLALKIDGFIAARSNGNSNGKSKGK
ncbi:MAG: flagellar motor switch protein FliM [Pseudomonadales bacterium]|nr:flagellar motor switch protein FliM [Pseudomonadales bacterium]MCP5358179.1 flagellar motor switch protein FliM [Pseudomonadales bacterium]